MTSKPVYRWASQLTPSGISAVPRRARLDPRPSEAVCQFCPGSILVSSLSFPQSWRCLRQGHALLQTPLLQFPATLMLFFHSLFRAGFQSSGWQLNPYLIISTPPRVMCKCGCAFPGHMSEGLCRLTGQLAGNNADPECLSACAEHQQVTSQPEGALCLQLASARAQAVVLKAAVTSMRAVSSGCKSPWPPPLPSLLWESVTHRPSPAVPSCGPEQDWFPPRGGMASSEFSAPQTAQRQEPNSVFQSNCRCEFFQRHSRHFV